MGLILLYHRVCDLVSDPQRLAVSPDRFSRQLEVLSAQFSPMTLPALVEHARRNTVPSGAVAVTFDDGYADNLENAKPLLERWGVPATVFLATAYVGGDREFWWDDLERLLLMPGRLPQMLRLRIGPATREWDLGRAARYDIETSRQFAGWHVERKDDPTPRHRVYRELCGLLRACPTKERDAVLQDLADLAHPSVGPRSTHRPLTAREVPELTRGGSTDIGAHSASHPTLSALSLEAQKAEILSSKSRVEALTGRSTTAFAYPFGMPGDYTETTTDLVRDAGLSCACAAAPGRIGPKTDPFRLPRVLVRDWEAATLEAHLKAWQ
jgi:peptidoglycan/xylan/chitin deacetylase (PgdA/CDA1 family)